ncbi:uncharacterized protein LOC119459585 [Dermacentor silvarum]|uniref:uncharacterized protein LOC119459585 n=1 Tax=Dermacentor silvarum TaxID=543639 RepID=UPI00189752C7|nr:uncharacterized protein LOC119459585 [Dermacentor silvarum]
MASLAIPIALLALSQLGNAANDYSKLVTARCDNAPNVDWTDSINALLRRIPETITIPSHTEKTWIAGFKTSSVEVTGLGSLWAYKPPHSFCFGNRTMIEAVVFADDLLAMNTEWKSCTGGSGKLGTRVSTSKMRIFFESDPTPEDPYRVRLQNIKPDSLDDPQLYMTGLSPAITGFVEALGIVGMPHLQLFWSRFLRIDVMYLIRDSLKI